MVGELSGIMNPTLWARIDETVVGKLIEARVNFWLVHLIKKI